MKSLMAQLKKVAVVLAVGAIAGGVAAFVLSPLGATVATIGWVLASGYGATAAAISVNL